MRHLMPLNSKEPIVDSTIELSSIIRAAMRDKNLDRQGIAALLGIGDVMVDKLLCGEIVPSRSLEKQMVEKLGIAPSRVRAVADRRDKESKSDSLAQNGHRVA